MVYESDFYTTRRPYSRPNISTYSVTRKRFIPGVGRAYHPSIPYIAHRRMNRLTTSVAHNQVRPSVIRGVLDHIQHKPRSRLSYDPMEDFLNERSTTSFDDVSRSIRAHTAALLKQVHAPVPRSIRPLSVVNTYNNYMEIPISERISSDEYILHLLRPLPGKPSNGLDISYYPESAHVHPLGRTHLACITYAAGQAIPRRRHLMVSGDNDFRNVRSDVELLSHYQKMRLAANNARPENGHTPRDIKRNEYAAYENEPTAILSQKEEKHINRTLNEETLINNIDAHKSSELGRNASSELTNGDILTECKNSGLNSGVSSDDINTPYNEHNEDEENISLFIINKRAPLKSKKSKETCSSSSVDESEQDNDRFSLLSKRNKRSSKDVSFDEISLAEQEKYKREKAEEENKRLEELKQLERLEVEQKQLEELEKQKKELEQLDTEQKELERLEAEQKQLERLEAEQRELERLETEQRELKEQEQKLEEKRLEKAKKDEQEQRLLEEKLAEEHAKEQERLKKEQELEELLANEYRKEQECKLEEQRKLQEKLSEERIAAEQKELEDKLLKIKEQQERLEQEQPEKSTEKHDGSNEEEELDSHEFCVTEHYESNRSSQKQKSRDDCSGSGQEYYKEREVRVNVRKLAINDGFDWGSMEVEMETPQEEQQEQGQIIEESKDYDESDEEPAVAETLHSTKESDNAELDITVARRESTRSQISNSETAAEKCKNINKEGTDKNKSNTNFDDDCSGESELSENEVEPIIDEPVTPSFNRRRHQDTIEFTEITSDEE